ncbi:hypothetical protein SBOR_7949 [Sclerotinia borealis F-4128]|uniref:Uncharacterized protein n=1 Tax=Sclerotinia borealis (strain F-4128) TaxID=1432307 RepID=W9C4J8_SCLBF|nr:hypothetical protein SBOR_7949 [Sclerotinia borealis F-4128]
MSLQERFLASSELTADEQYLVIDYFDMALPNIIEKNSERIVDVEVLQTGSVNRHRFSEEKAEVEMWEIVTAEEEGILRK